VGNGEASAVGVTRAADEEGWRGERRGEEKGRGTIVAMTTMDIRADMEAAAKQ
jgi:hypothetical protein